jgi:uncharacterized membrane protein YkvA (DUF1232 family)
MRRGIHSRRNSIPSRQARLSLDAMSDGFLPDASLLIGVGVAALILVVIGTGVWYLRRSAGSAEEARKELRLAGSDLVRLPVRLKRVAADPRTPRRAKWALVALIAYIASPVDLIPDFIPVIGLLDEIVIVPLALRRIRRMIPDEVWAEQFPGRPRGERD